jgi:hypothetical protein
MAETSTKKHLSVTVFYLLTAMGIGWPAFAATGTVLPRWRSGETLAPLSLAVIHTLVLGSMLTIAFGVLYQIVPIAFQAPPVARHVLWWHLPVHLVSVGLMVAGFLRGDYLFVGIGGTTVLLAAGAYFYFVLMSYRKARNKTVVHRSLVIPFAALFLVILLGIFQALWPQAVTLSVLLSHILIGGLLFWGGLVLVVSYKLIPMFVLSHGYKASLARTAGLYFPGVGLWIIAVWLPEQAFTPVYMAITILVVFGLVSFVVDIIAIVRARKRKRIVPPLYDALFATFVIIVSQIWLVGVVWAGRGTMAVLPIYLFIFLGLVPLMFAYMQKIVPFLWFEYRFSKRPERKTAPLIDDMVPKVPAQVGFIVYCTGAIIGAASVGAGRASLLWTLLDWLSAILLTGGSVVLFLALQHVLTIGGRRPEDDVPPERLP